MYPYYNPYNFQQPQTFQQQNLQQRTPILNGRVVTNIEEARAAQIDLDGSQWFFPCPSEGKVYSKSINMQGLPVFQVYELKKNVENSIQKVDNSQLLSTLQSRIEKLEDMVKRLNKDEYIADDEPITV